MAASVTVLVVLGGRSPLPFGQAFLPALPACSHGQRDVFDLFRRAELADIVDNPKAS